MENYVIGAVLALLIGGSIAYLVRAKKRGQGCVGCPYAKQCGEKRKGCPSSDEREQSV